MRSRSGELAMRPLPAVLLDLHDELATGELVLQRGRVSKIIELVDGDPVSTASTPRDETLGVFLVNGRVISEHQHRRAIVHASEFGGKFGEALVAQGVLTEHQLAAQLGNQACHKIVQALRWPQGAWRFEVGVVPVATIQLGMIEVVVSGLKETAAEDLDRLAKLDGASLEMTRRGLRMRREFERAFGERALAKLAIGATMHELEAAFPDRVQARIAVDALVLCDAVVARAGQFGLGSQPVAQTTLPCVGRPSVGRTPTTPALFDLLFDDVGTASEGATPIEFAEAEIKDESGVVSIGDISTANRDNQQATRASQALTTEYQRMLGADHYAVLMISRRAQSDEIEAAATIRTSLLDHHAASPAGPREREKLDGLRRAYAAARAVLLDDRKRAAYDRELAGGELVQVPPAIDTELNFRTAEQLIERKQWSQAIGLIRTVIARSPGEADYHAALGWAEWKAGCESPEAADVARPHLNTALEIDPDHAAAHDYKGRIDASVRNDDAEALFHLERAIDLDPGRNDAVAAVESLLVGRGELRRYERVLKRLLFRLRGRGSLAEANAWLRLSRLQLDHLDDPAAAAAAAVNARRIAPNDDDVIAHARRTEDREHAAPIRAGWREALGDPASGAALVHITEASGHVDAAFLAASTMVALGTADPEMAAVYESNRVRGVAIPTRPIGRDHWALLRHKDDSREIGALIELVAPAVHGVAPMTLADGELDASQRIDDGELPAVFLRLRRRYACVLGVDAAAVYPSAELGAQIHVVACDPPVLVAGDEALTSPERPELAFRLARAMTFLWPGRAVGASRPGRVLRAVVMAVFREASGSAIGIDDPLAESAAAAVAGLTGLARVQARAAALRLLSHGEALNLTSWARSLSRTADRTGMLLCGDVPAAFGGAKDAGELDRELVEFAYSAVHVRLRGELGLARA